MNIELFFLSQNKYINVHREIIQNLFDGVAKKTEAFVIIVLDII